MLGLRTLVYDTRSDMAEDPLILLFYFQLLINKNILNCLLIFHLTLCEHMIRKI